MAIKVYVLNQQPAITLDNFATVTVDAGSETTVINYAVLKGDQGIPGSDADVSVHEDLYDHGDLHAHENKALLDLISYTPDQGFMYDGHVNYTRQAFITFVRCTLDYQGNLISVDRSLTVDLGYLTVGQTTLNITVDADYIAKPANIANWSWRITLNGAVSAVGLEESGSILVSQIFGLNLYVTAGWYFTEDPPPPGP